MQFEPPTKPTDVTVNINGGDAASQGVDHNGIVTGRWKTSIFGCFDTLVPNAIMSWCCPAISVAQIAARVGMMPFYHVLGAFAVLYVLAFLAAVTNAKFFNVIFWLAWVVAVVCMFRVRMRLRTAFSIPGSGLEDALYAVFCGCCSIAQMATHVESYETGKFAIAPRETLPGYTFN